MSAGAAVAAGTIGDLRRRAGALLRAAGIDNAASEADWLLASVLDVPRHVLLLEGGRPISPVQAERAWSCFRRRAAREPLQYLLGTQEFRGLNMAVTPDVLIPRPETELLVAETLRAAAAVTGPAIVDVGTGSGCIAVAIACERPDARVYALDISARALAVALSNAVRHGVRERIGFLRADLLGAFAAAAGSRFDVIVSNPPYIPAHEVNGLQPEVSRYEPRVALAAGNDGLACQRRLLQDAPALLRRGGYLLVEMGCGQEEVMTRLAWARGAFESVECRNDDAGIARVLIARKKTA